MISVYELWLRVAWAAFWFFLAGMMLERILSMKKRRITRKPGAGARAANQRRKSNGK